MRTSVRITSAKRYKTFVSSDKACIKCVVPGLGKLNKQIIEMQQERDYGL